MPAAQLEAALCDWLAKCHPDDRLEAAVRALLQRGLRHRRTTVREWYEHHTVKELEARLERTHCLWQDANAEQRARLAASIITEIHAAGGWITAVRPRPRCAPHFEELLVHHGAGDESLPTHRNLPLPPAGGGAVWTLRGLSLVTCYGP